MSSEQNNLLNQGMIHVDEYTRSDGAHVDEHWRARNGNAKMSTPTGQSNIVAPQPDYDPEKEEQQKKESIKAMVEDTRLAINKAIGLMPNAPVKNILTSINNLATLPSAREEDELVLGRPTTSDGPVMHLQDSFNKYATKIDSLNKKTISKKDVNPVMGTVTNALFGQSLGLSQIAETQDSEQKQSIIESAKKAVKSLLGLTSSVKEEISKDFDQIETLAPDEKQRTVKTYESLKELEDATYRYENLLGEGLFEDADKASKRIFDLSKVFFQNAKG